MLDRITEINGWVGKLVWGTPMLVLLVGSGIFLTILNGGFQFRYLRHWLKSTLGSLFEKKVQTDGTSISQFQSLCVALAATIGTGNIVGVASAIASGGPGAVFWMWVAAVFGMMTGFSEKVLGIYYRHRKKDGQWCGGAMYYLRDGLGTKKHCRIFGMILAILFSVFCLLASFGIGNMSQVNAIAGNMENVFGIEPALTGAVLTVLTGIVITGGMKRVALVAEKLIPFMAVAYLFGTLAIFFSNFKQIPDVLNAVFKGAFGMKAAGGGIVGYGMKTAVTLGMKRGVFSNEAGLGSSVIVHANADVCEPVQQGMWGILEVFVDTILVCTLTAFSILSVGLVNLRTGEMISDLPPSALSGEAFSSVFGKAGGIFIAAAILLFAFTTLLGWSQYGIRAVEFLFGARAGGFYQIVFIGIVFWGAVMKVGAVWELSDTFNGLMAVPNLIGVLTLSPAVHRITKNYVNRKIKQKSEKPLLSAFPEIQREQEKKQ